MPHIRDPVTGECVVCEKGKTRINKPTNLSNKPVPNVRKNLPPTSSSVSPQKFNEYVKVVIVNPEVLSRNQGIQNDTLTRSIGKAIQQNSRKSDNMDPATQQNQWHTHSNYHDMSHCNVTTPEDFSSRRLVKDPPTQRSTVSRGCSPHTRLTGPDPGYTNPPNTNPNTNPAFLNQLPQNQQPILVMPSYPVPQQYMNYEYSSPRYQMMPQWDNRSTGGVTGGHNRFDYRKERDYSEDRNVMEPRSTNRNPFVIGQSYRDLESDDDSFRYLPRENEIPTFNKLPASERNSRRAIRFQDEIYYDHTANTDRPMKQNTNQNSTSKTCMVM